MGIRKKPRRHSRRTLGNEQELSPLTRFIDALGAEKTRFIVVGMTGAVLQGTPVTTFDVDLWVDLPARQSMRMINLARTLGADMLANTVVVFPGDVTVNFIYEVTGLRSFSSEFRESREIKWLRRKVRVLPLERIYANKKAAGRPKDLAHLPVLEQTMKLQRRRRRK